MNIRAKYFVVDYVVLLSAITLFCGFSVLLYLHAPGLLAHFEGDSTRYHFIAHHIHALTFIPLEVLGYPLFLSFLYALRDAVVSVVIAQVILSIVSLFLLRRIVLRLTDDRRVAIAVTLLWAGNLGFLIYTQLVLIEVILAFLLLWFVDRMIACYQFPSYCRAAGAAFILGISILFRPAALFYSLVVAIGFLFLTKMSLRKRIVFMVVFITVFYIPVVGYMLVNYRLFNQFVLCPVMNTNLFVFFYPKIQAAFAQLGLPVNDTMRTIESDIAREHITMTTQSHLLTLFVQYPTITLGIWAQNMLKSFLGLYQTQWKLYFELADKATSFFSLSGNWFDRLSGYVMVGTTRTWLHVLGWYELVYLLIEYVMGLCGIIWLLRQHHYWLLTFALSFVSYFAFITGPDGSGRFRMMMEPWLLVIAAIGLLIFIIPDDKK